MKWRLFFLSLFVSNIYGFLTYSQVSEAGLPITINSDYSQFDVNSVDVSNSTIKLIGKRTTSVTSSDKLAPFQFAYPILVDINAKNSGSWFLDEKGETRVWLCAIKSKDAFSLSLLFNKLYITPRGRLYVYNKSKSSFLGAFSYRNNRVDNTFSIAPLEGDELILEFSQPITENESPEISISQVNHDYVDVFKYLNVKSFGDFGSSGDCNVDITTDSNYSTLSQERSVCRLLIGGIEFCTGTMVANSSGDSSIYVLTAAHCLSSQSQATNTIFYYNYQSPHGDGRIQGSLDFQTSGATLVASVVAGDFTLLKLDGERPEVSYRPFLSGWNYATSPNPPFYCIHHPSGDVKKISKTNSIQNSSFNTPDFITDFHWNIAQWESGTTEGGSSGAAIFDGNGLLVGTLSGGEASCGNSVNDYFVRFNRAWATYPEPAKQLSAWLDPSSVTSPSTPLLGHEYYGAQSPNRLSNVTSLDTGYFRSVSGFYPIGLYNQSSIKKVAEAYSDLSNKKLEGFYLSVGKSSSSPTGKLKYMVYSGASLPETLLYESAELPLTLFSSQKEKFIKMPVDLILNGKVFVSVELVNALATDTIALFVSDKHKDGSLRNSNSAFVYDGLNWQAYDYFTGNGNGSVWIDLVVSEPVNSSLLSKSKVNQFIEIYPNPASTFFNIDLAEQCCVVDKVLLTTMHGEEFSLDCTQENVQLHVVIPSNLKSGFYLVSVVSNCGVSISKLILKR